MPFISPASRRGFLATVRLLNGLFAKAPAKAAQFEFRSASDQPPDDPTSIRITQMWGNVERESGGRIHTIYFPPRELGADLEIGFQLRLGAFQFLLLSPGNLASVVPGADITSLGFAYKDAEEAQRVMDGPVGAFVRRETALKGLYAFPLIWDSGMFEIGASTRPIRTPDDLRGFKIRVNSSKIASNLFKDQRANPGARTKS